MRFWREAKPYLVTAGVSLAVFFANSQPAVNNLVDVGLTRLGGAADTALTGDLENKITAGQDLAIFFMKTADFFRDTAQGAEGMPMDHNSRIQRNGLVVEDKTKYLNITADVVQEAFSAAEFVGNRNLAYTMLALKSSETCELPVTADTNGNICISKKGPVVTNGVNSSDAGGTYQFKKNTFTGVVARAVKEKKITQEQANEMVWRDLHSDSIAAALMLQGKGMDALTKTANQFTDVFTKANNGYTCWNIVPSQANAVFNNARKLAMADGVKF